MKIFSMEGIDDTRQVVDPITDLDPDDHINDSLELDLYKTHDAAYQEADNIADAQAVMSRLSEIHDEVQASVNNGHLKPVDLNTIEIAVESLLAQVGYTQPVKYRTALEACTVDKRTELALESISESLKKIGNAIMKTIQKVIEHITNFITSILHNSMILERRIKALRSEVNALDSNLKVDKVEFHSKTLKDFLIDPKEEVILPSEFSRELSRMGEFLSAMSSKSVEVAKEMGDLLSKDAGKFSIRSGSPAILRAFSKLIATEYSGKRSKEIEDKYQKEVIATEYPLSFGGYSVVTTLVKQSTDKPIMIDTIKDVGIYIKRAHRSHPSVSDSVFALDKKEAEKTLDVCNKLLNDNKSSTNELKRAMDELKKIGRKSHEMLISRYANQSTREDNMLIYIIINIVVKLLSRGKVAFTHLTQELCVDALKYVGHSLKAIKNSVKQKDGILPQSTHS